MPPAGVSKAIGTQVYVAAANGIKSLGDAAHVRGILGVDGGDICEGSICGESIDCAALGEGCSTIIVINRNDYLESDFDEDREHKGKFDPFRQNKKEEDAPTENQSKADAIYIDEDEGSFEQTVNGIDISLTNSFGSGIKELVDVLTEPVNGGEPR
jgi:hypothetical protein